MAGCQSLRECESLSLRECVGVKHSATTCLLALHCSSLERQVCSSRPPTTRLFRPMLRSRAVVAFCRPHDTRPQALRTGVQVTMHRGGRRGVVRSQRQ
jgi:hypothetical protein